MAAATAAVCGEKGAMADMGVIECVAAGSRLMNKSRAPYEWWWLGAASDE